MERVKCLIRRDLLRVKAANERAREGRAEVLGRLISNPIPGLCCKGIPSKTGRHVCPKGQERSQVRDLECRGGFGIDLAICATVDALMANKHANQG